MKVAVISVGVVKGAVDAVIDVVAVGHRGVSAAGPVAFRALDRRAGRREPVIHIQPVLVVVGPVGRVKVPVVKVVGMIAVADPLVSTARAMRMRMVPVVGASHRRVPSPADGLALPHPSQWRGALVLLAAGLAAGCGGSRAPGMARVAAGTIAPIADLLSRVAGPGWDVRTIVPPGTSPHLFEPRPGDVRRLSGAMLVVEVGGGYDGWAAGLAASASGAAILLDAGAALGIGLEEGETAAGHGHGGHGGEEGPDPHWWLSPPLAARSLRPMAEALSRADPAGAEGYRARATRTASELERLDRDLAEALAPFRGRAFLAAHPAWPYFAGRYGLRQAGSIEPAPGREPSPRELRTLIDEARAGGFDVLFTEPQFPESAARVVASDGGLRLALLDPIGGVEGRRTYLEMMRFNGASFVKAFAEGRRRPG